jgi:fido (protein-threonine AMPylation protein)
MLTSRKHYRVETNYFDGKPYYYLAKDVKYKSKRTKVRVYLGHILPSADEIEKLRMTYAFELEARAAEKRAELSSTFYLPKYLTPEGIKNVEKIRHYNRTFLDALTPSEVAVYQQAFEINYIHGTTSIEGNTFSSNQAFDLLINNITPNDKTLREINEVQNFKKVVVFREKYKGKVTLDFIKTLHSLIMNNIDIESAGVFRRIDVGIAGCDISLTPAILIKPELNKLIDEYYEQLDNAVHPFEAAVLFHYGFELIHPFTDGNGRVGREIFNYMLRKCGYPRLLFLGRDRETYLQSLKFGNEEMYPQMISLFVDLIMRQQMNVLIERIKEVTTPIRKEQLTLDECFKELKK